MPTPVEVFPNTQANFGTAATGEQTNSLITGLSNGNFLVSWEENTGDAIAASFGKDIVGQIFDPQGNAIGTAFQLNHSRITDNETDFDIAATNDGGFIVAYIDIDQNNMRTSVIFDRFSASRSFIVGTQIADENLAGNNLSNPEIALNLLTNDFAVSYTNKIATNENVNAVVVTWGAGNAFTLSPEISAAQNSADRDADADLAVLADGNYVSVYEEADGPVTSIESKIFKPDGSMVSYSLVNNEASDAPQVAALANGQFVVIWVAANDIHARVFQPNGAPIGLQFAVADKVTAENEPDVAALPGGGFVVHWNDESFGQRARLFLADGTPDGDVFDVDAGNTTQSAISVTADGRILMNWKENGEIHFSIWDPREGSIDVTEYRAELTNFLANSGRFIGSPAGDDHMAGSAVRDIMLGLGGRDTIIGGAGNDRLFGNNGNDKLVGGDGNDLLQGNNGRDLVLGGRGDDRLYGGKGPDDLLGNAGKDVFFGEGGRDVMTGGGGPDRFVFRALSDTGNTAGRGDLITDFRDGIDRIDLHFIDASTRLAGNNQFAWNDTSPFGADLGGEVFYRQFDHPGTARDFTLVFLDTDADNASEGIIKLRGLHDLTADDFTF